MMTITVTIRFDHDDNNDVDDDEDEGEGEGEGEDIEEGKIPHASGGFPHDPTAVLGQSSHRHEHVFHGFGVAKGEDGVEG